MKKWAILFWGLVAGQGAIAAGPIGTLGVTDVLTIGGYQMLCNSGPGSGGTFRILACYTTNAQKCTMRDTVAGANAGYQIPGGKTFYIRAVSVLNQTGGTISYNLYQSNNDLGMASGGSLTSAVCVPSAEPSGCGGYLFQSTTISEFKQIPLHYPVAATRYLSVDASNVSHFFAYGCEK